MLVTSGTYAYLEMKKNTSVAGSAKCNGINYQGEEINASNLSSTTNYLEGAKSTITLSQSEDCKIYSYVNIYLHVNDNITAPIDSIKALKYKLITEDKIEYNGTITTKGDSLLAVVPLTSNPKSYQVYLWIDSEISNGQFDNKSFSGYIYATSEQSSTIGGGEISNNENVSIETIDFDYVGREQEFIVPVSGDYKLETWGAQGGDAKEYAGGYGGYSVGIIKANRIDNLYISVGGKGTDNNGGDYPYNNKVNGIGGYNGGGASQNNSDTSTSYIGAGGGATSIYNLLIENGELKNYEKNKDNILIVSGGGGGSNYWGAESSLSLGLLPEYGIGGSGGGNLGNDGTMVVKAEDIFHNEHQVGKGGSQLQGGIYEAFFGKGGVRNTVLGSSGGGAGFYGGGGSTNNCGGGGGSGYIGNSLLTNKAMYCYNCEESDEVETKTISTTNVSDDAISGYAKKGNGYSRITLIK